MKTIVAGFWTVLFALTASGLPLDGAASPAPAASPGAASAAPMYCDARIGFGVGLDAAPGSPLARTWALALATLDTNSASGSGSLALFVGTKHYEIPFVNAALAASSEDMLHVATPIVVRFPQPVVVDGGYVSTIGGDAAGACPPHAVWTRQQHQPPQTDFTKRASEITAVAAPDPELWKGACAKPVVGANLTAAVQPAQMPATGQESGTGTAVVVVAVGRDGKAAGARVIGSTGKAWLDRAALKEANASSYSPASFDCQPIEGAYIFVVEFTPGAANGADYLTP